MRWIGFIALAALAGGCRPGNPQVCPADTNCNQPPPATLKLAVQLVPPEASSFVAQETASITFDPSGVAVLSLAPTTRIEGLVLGANDEPIAAQVIVSRPSLIPGSADVVVQTTTEGPPTAGMNLPGRDPVVPGHFAIRVPRLIGPIFTLSVVPQSPADATYPPTSRVVAVDHDQTDLVFCLGGNARSKLCPALAVPGIALSGRVATDADKPIAGVRVVATDVNSGEPLSSVAVTAGDGTFQVNLSPNVRPDDQVRFVATPDPLTIMPTLGLVELVSGVGASCTDQDCSNTGLECVKSGIKHCAVVLKMPALAPKMQFILPVHGTAATGAELMLPGVRVDFKTKLSYSANPKTDVATDAQFGSSVLTDAAGNATVDLPPGNGNTQQVYQVTLIPPADSMFARAMMPISIGPAGGVLDTVALGLRPQVYGQLVNSSGQPVKGAVVTAQPAAAALNLGVESAVDLTVPMTVTGDDGSFSVRVDRGSYDIELVPQQADMLARWSIDNRAVTDGDIDLRTVPLPRGVLTQVRVIDPDGQPVTSVEVRIFLVAYADSCPKEKPSCPPLLSRLRGQGITTADGSAPLLLPSP